MKEKVIKFLNFLFPYGNWRYYVMYLSSLFVLGILSILLPTMMNIMTDGMYVYTDVFVAHSTSSFPPRSDFAMSIVYNLFNLFGYTWLILAVHTALSLIADFVVRPILWVIKTMKIIIFGYD